MKALVMCYEFPPLGGGGSRVVFGLSRELVRLGYEVDVVTMGFSGLAKCEVVEGIRVHRVACLRRQKTICTAPELFTYLVSAGILIWRMLRRNSYDIYHAHFIFPDGILAWGIKHLTGKSYLITAHGSDVPGYNPHRFVFLHRILAPIWSRVVRGAEAIVCPTEYLASLIRKQTDQVRTVIIPNGFDLYRFDPSREKNGRILLVSRLFERKGLQYFLRAIDGLDHQHEIHIVGDGPYLETLRTIAAQMRANIRFWGWLDNTSPELKELYETSRIFVFPSVAENFPIVMLEAMSSGLAIIATKGTGSAEVVGDTAVMVEMRSPESIKEALTKLMNDPMLCLQLGRAARKRLEENFGWPAVASRYTEAFQTVEPRPWTH
jgi:glycosyltransferase involved in cell wall biosynthesis